MLYSLLYLLAFIAVAAVILWGLGQMPLDPTLAKIIRVIVIVVIAIVAIYFLVGLAQDLPDFGPRGRLR